MEDDSMGAGQAAAAQDTPEAAFLRSLTDPEITKYVVGKDKPLVGFFTAKGLQVRSADIQPFMNRVKALYQQQQGLSASRSSSVASLAATRIGGASTVNGWGGMGSSMGSGMGSSMGGMGSSMGGMGSSMGGMGSSMGSGMGGTKLSPIGENSAMNNASRGVDPTIRVTNRPPSVTAVNVDTGEELLDPATSTAMVLYQPFEQPSPGAVPDLNVPANQTATATQPITSNIVKLLLRELIFGTLRVPVAGGRYLISQILKTVEERNRTPSTLLEVIRSNPAVRLNEIQYSHELLGVLRSEAAKSSPGIDANTLALAITTFEIGLETLTATFNMLASFNELMNTYTPLRSVQSSGPATAAVGMNMAPAGYGGKECDLLKKYMIYVYYARLKFKKRGIFSEEWADIDREIRLRYESKEATQSILKWLASKVSSAFGIKKTGPLPKRNVSIYTYRGAPLATLISENEMRLINGVISNILQNDFVCTNPELKVLFSQYLVMTEMDVAKVVPATAPAFTLFVKDLINKSLGGGMARSVLAEAISGMSRRNFKPLFNLKDVETQLALQKKTAKAAAEAAAALAQSHADGMLGGPLETSVYQRIGQTLGLAFGGVAAAGALAGYDAASAAVARTGTAVTNALSDLFRGAREGIAPVGVLFSKLAPGTYRIIDATGQAFYDVNEFLASQVAVGPMQLVVNATGDIAQAVVGAADTTYRKIASIVDFASVVPGNVFGNSGASSRSGAAPQPYRAGAGGMNASSGGGGGSALPTGASARSGGGGGWGALSGPLPSLFAAAQAKRNGSAAMVNVGEEQGGGYRRRTHKRKHRVTHRRRRQSTVHRKRRQTRRS